MGLKYSVKHAANRCAGIQALLFTEQRQNRFSIILKGSRISRMVSEHWFQLKSTAVLAPDKSHYTL